MINSKRKMKKMKTVSQPILKEPKKRGRKPKKESIESPKKLISSPKEKKQRVKKVKEEKPPKIKKQTKKIYVDKKEMISELRYFKSTGIISEKLGQMFIDIATHLSTKGCFYNYSYKRDMIRDAVARMVMQIDRFNPEHPMANPFWYFSTVATRQFLTYIKSEKRYANTKEIVSDKYIDDLIEYTGMIDPRLKNNIDDMSDDDFTTTKDTVSYYQKECDNTYYVNGDAVDLTDEEEGEEVKVEKSEEEDEEVEETE